MFSLNPCCIGKGRFYGRESLKKAILVLILVVLERGGSMERVLLKGFDIES